MTTAAGSYVNMLIIRVSARMPSFSLLASLARHFKWVVLQPAPQEPKVDSGVKADVEAQAVENTPNLACQGRR